MLRSLAIGQGIIFLFIVINLFVPQEYYQIIMPAYFIVFMAFIFLSTMRRYKGGSNIKDIVSGKKVLTIKQDEAMNLQMKDQELISELKPLFKVSMTSIISLVLVLIWFYMIYPGLVQPHFNAAGGGLIMRVVGLLVLYEIPAVISLTMQIGSRKLIKKYVNVLRSAEVYTTGIIGNPGFTLKFPIQGYSVRFCPTRNFVEFVKLEGGVEIIFRVYTSDAERLAEVISRYGKVRADKVA
jgi:uncharacterized membrane protein